MGHSRRDWDSNNSYRFECRNDICIEYVYRSAFHRNPFRWKCMKVHNTTAPLPFILSSFCSFHPAVYGRLETSGKISFSTKYSSSLSPCIRFIACDITKGNKVEQHNNNNNNNHQPYPNTCNNH